MSSPTTQALGQDESSIQLALRREKFRLFKQKRLLYLMLLLPMASAFVFNYVPMYGLIIAFKNYHYNLGYWGSPWNNFAHFKRLFGDYYFWRIFKNTIIISFLRVAFEFPAPIILALLVNEVRSNSLKRTVQSITYLPHFLSWVVLGGIIMQVLSPESGVVGWIFNLIHKPAPLLLTSNRAFRPLLVITSIWKEVGWGTVIYLAGISGIDPGLYESAVIDGANRFQAARFITLPSLIPIIVIVFTLSLGHIMNAGFDQIFKLYNPVVYKVADIIDTYVYRMGILQQQFDFTTAVGLFKNVIGVVLIVGTNIIVRRLTEYGLW